MKTTYLVKGMTCDHCVHAVTDELMALPGVSRVEVDLETGEVIVDSVADLTREFVAAAVVEAGYELVA